MDPVLFGLTSDTDTNHAITHLNDAKIPFLFTDLGYPDSLASQHVAVLANSDELPVLIHQGVTYVGLAAVRGYRRD